MISIKGTYDGKKLKLRKHIKINEPREVIVTFLDEEFDYNEIYKVAEKSESLNFLHEEAEDIYTDDDLKVKYK